MRRNGDAEGFLPQPVLRRTSAWLTELAVSKDARKQEILEAVRLMAPSPNMPAQAIKANGMRGNPPSCRIGPIAVHGLPWRGKPQSCAPHGSLQSVFHSFTVSALPVVANTISPAAAPVALR